MALEVLLGEGILAILCVRSRGAQGVLVSAFCCLRRVEWFFCASLICFFLLHGADVLGPGVALSVWLRKIRGISKNLAGKDVAKALGDLGLFLPDIFASLPSLEAFHLTPKP